MMRAAETETFEQNVHHVFLQLLPLLGTDDFREGVAAFLEKRAGRLHRTMTAEPRAVTLLEGLATTRAIRRYTDDPIPDADLAEILWYAAAGAVGHQPPAVPLPHAAPRRPGGARRRGRCSAESFRRGVGRQAGRPRPRRRAGAEGSPRARMQAAMQHYVDHSTQCR